MENQETVSNIENTGSIEQIDHFAIRRLNDASEIIESITVRYNPLALTVSKMDKLRKMADKMKFMEYDLSKVTSKADESKGAIKSLDLVGMENAKREALYECVLIVFDLKKEGWDLDHIPSSDFLPLYQLVLDKDVLGFQADDQMQKKMIN